MYVYESVHVLVTNSWIKILKRVKDNHVKTLSSRYIKVSKDFISLLKSPSQLTFSSK